MIEAANIKKLPEYSYSTFDLRAKTVIEDSQVVPLISLEEVKNRLQLYQVWV
ncbi:hypothetical protein TanjilG_03392 [Lupinus angustifolius]|uniref:Uncharacterized protein n=1 Tax=Lupinus angustifolius TaxID=3871 RepID=A0A4P1RDR1_LUPAN|nr:hypothetical protein TanjilG_03392 [Lupinus angustifolius]